MTNWAYGFLTGSVLASLLGLFAYSEPVFAQDNTVLDKISDIGGTSKCASYEWKDRGLAKRAYLRGMALVFARAVCHAGRDDVRAVSAARGATGTNAEKTDALTWYEDIFKSMGMKNDSDGLDTLRHSYVLLTGLGMRESSGQYCEGRDLSADFTSADSAEAGLFQTSWGAHTKHAELDKLYAAYTAGERGCYLDTFKKNVSCRRSSAKNWGNTESTGFKWQVLTKSCPAFAAEYAAVLIRVHGGSKGEFGPLRKHKAEVNADCDQMFKDVQQLIESTPGSCDSLK